MNEKIITLTANRRGAWLVIISRHLIRYDTTEPALATLDGISFAGKCGSLLIKLSADETEQLTEAKVTAHARLCGIDRIELQIYRNTLKVHGCLDFDEKSRIYEILSFSRERVLDTTTRIFNELVTATDDERLLPDLLEFCLVRPRLESEVKEFLSAEFSEEKIEHLLGVVRTLDLLGYLSLDKQRERLYFNGYQFGERAADIGKALAALPREEREYLDTLLEYITDQPGMPPESIKVPQRVKTLAVGLGLVDESKVHSAAGDASFYTRLGFALPSVGREISNLEDDVFNHAKMLLASIRYGEFRSTWSRGRIIDPKWILGALLRRDRVGPCTAIGQDYVVLEGEGVIKTIQAENELGEQFYMELRRSEPASIAYGLLKPGEKATMDAKSLPQSLELPLSYTGPEISRPQAAQKVVRHDPETIKRFYEELRT